MIFKQIMFVWCLWTIKICYRESKLITCPCLVPFIIYFGVDDKVNLCSFFYSGKQMFVNLDESLIRSFPRKIDKLSECKPYEQDI